MVIQLSVFALKRKQEARGVVKSSSFSSAHAWKRIRTSHLLSLFFAWRLGMPPVPCLASAPQPVHLSSDMVYVDRSSKQLWVADANHKILLRTSVGIGRGGIRRKLSMDDFVTPTGKFTVDLILFKDKTFNRLATDNVARYRGTKFSDLLSSCDGLARLFSNMNSLDFDGDGKADRAYGDGYIGITSTSKGEVTGPKMQYLGQVPYWYSIALHGTNDPASIGGSKSGGCIHVPANILSKLICGRLVNIGTTVVISDKTPSWAHRSAENLKK
jgi:hypothetical protein